MGKIKCRSGSDGPVDGTVEAFGVVGEIVFPDLSRQSGILHQRTAMRHQLLIFPEIDIQHPDIHFDVGFGSGRKRVAEV